MSHRYYRRPMKNTLLFIMLLIVYLPVYSGEKSCNCTVEDIEKETSYLAKKLLQLTKKDQFVIEHEKSMETIIGFCTEVTTHGINLTCITPDLDPFKKGMLTGDKVLRIDEYNFVNNTLKASQKAFDNMKAQIKPGDLLTIEYIRDDELKEVKVKVSQITHPGFRLEVYQ